MRTDTKAARLELRARRLSKDMKLVPGPAGGAVYIYEVERNGKRHPCADAYRGTAAKPEWRYSFQNDEQRKAAIQKFWESLTARAERRAAQAKATSEWVNPLTVGQILYTSWGYDQTNVDYYVITRASGKRVWVREIAGRYVETGPMALAGKSEPELPVRFLENRPETLHIARYDGYKGASLNIKGHSAGPHAEGQVHYESHYA